MDKEVRYWRNSRSKELKVIFNQWSVIKGERDQRLRFVSCPQHAQREKQSKASGIFIVIPKALIGNIIKVNSSGGMSFLFCV